MLWWSGWFGMESIHFKFFSWCIFDLQLCVHFWCIVKWFSHMCVCVCIIFHILFHYGLFSLVQFSCSVVSNSLWPHESQHARPPCPSPTPGACLLKLMSIESMIPSNHLILCRPLLLSPSIFPSIRVFSNESVLRIRWPKYRSFSFSINPSNEYSGLISFRMDWLDLLAVQGILKSLLQHHFLEPKRPQIAKTILRKKNRAGTVKYHTPWLLTMV